MPINLLLMATLNGAPAFQPVRWTQDGAVVATAHTASLEVSPGTYEFCAKLGGIRRCRVVATATAQHQVTIDLTPLTDNLAAQAPSFREGLAALSLHGFSVCP